MKLTDSRFLILFLISIFIWGFVYTDALISMEGTWRRSDTFAHGYFMLPISLWLLWRDKTYLLSSYAMTSWLPLPILAGSLIVWLLAYAADINVLGELSAIVSLICIIWILIGNKLAWRCKFPLAYLLFAVPMGESLIPWLQDVTAWFTVAFLKIHGIPVFQDGLYIQIPSGLFEVAVACSGIRYLIASVAVGTLFAYLTYTSSKKQIIFIIFSAFVPILANGIRAYLIVIIAHYSDMEYATGADHLVYGWVFFGFVVMFMFWVGGKFADAEIVRDVNNQSVQPSKYLIAFPLISWGLLVTIILIVQQVIITTKPEKLTASLQQNDNFKEVVSSDWGITYETGLQRSHLINEKGLEVFNAVYSHKQNEGELISFSNKVFYPSGWTIIKSKTIVINDHPAKYLLLHNTKGVERVIVYWFDIASDIVINKNQAKMLQALSVYRAPTSRAKIVAFSMKNVEEESFMSQVEDILPTINHTLAKTN